MAPWIAAAPLLGSVSSTKAPDGIQYEANPHAVSADRGAASAEVALRALPPTARPARTALPMASVRMERGRRLRRPGDRARMRPARESRPVGPDMPLACRIGGGFSVSQLTAVLSAG